MNTSTPIRPKTLSQFIVDQQEQSPGLKARLKALLHDLSIAAKIVHRAVNKAGLIDILGSAEQSNVHGETQQKLDQFANEEFIQALIAGGECCVIASEENDDIIPVTTPYGKNAKYVVLMDPVDGSSNTDVNVSIGTIFSVYERVSDKGTVASEADCLQAGAKQVAAGYVVYGSSTMLVFTTGAGVHGFTLDPSIGEFCLSHPNMMIPQNGRIYSINEGNYQRFQQGIRKFIKYCQEERHENERPYVSRHIGSLVADFHRNLIQGGVFIYPASREYKNGKLRLLYECNPLAFIVEQAGGFASNGYERIVELTPSQIHERTPFIIGSPDMVRLVETYIKEYAPVVMNA